MRSRLLACIIVLAFTSTIVGAADPEQPVYAASQPAASAVTLPEGNDYATQVLRDPWDMSQYSDISQYINRSGQANLIKNISVQDGVFSAQTAAAYAHFDPLFPGYEGALKVGKVGHRYPVQSSKYHCMNLAMQVGPAAGDYHLYYWFADHLFERGSLGKSNIYTNSSGWKLYKLDLNTARMEGTAWGARSSWQGLRIIPSKNSNTPFSVDWIRLTDCRPVTTTIQWNGGRATIFVRPSGTNREIEVASNVSSPHDLDVSGIQPGSYTILVKNASNNLLGSTDIVINPAPIIHFEKPSVTSGTEYSTNAGNAWDLSDPSDAYAIDCTDSSFANGWLALTTRSIEQQSGSCNGGGVSDPRIWLRRMQPASTSTYRYLSFRLNTEGAWQNVPRGMITRWIWTIFGHSGANGSRCTLVSDDIPIDVGWHTYSIDLADPANGQAIAMVGDCPARLPTWASSSQAQEMRLDPNENILGYPLQQAIDWIRLTAVDSVPTGGRFPIAISLNKPRQALHSLEFYYTDDPTDPCQHAIKLAPPAIAAPPPEGEFMAFIPFVHNGPVSDPVSSEDVWDTTGVPPGTYFICAQADDGFNQGTYCSEAPVKVK